MIGPGRASARHTLAWLALMWPAAALAVSGVSPEGANVSATGVTSAFFTFRNLTPSERAVDAYWCGDLVVSGGLSFLTSFDPCVPGTYFGRLPQRNDLSRPSGIGGVRNLTDVMTIPTSVARRAYQAAQAGRPSDFFYVRRFNDGVQDTFVAITCRLTGGGARAQLALTEVRLHFDLPEGQRPVYFIGRNDPLPPFSAAITYNGAGRLTGRWELVNPNDPEPRVEDLLTEATLPIEQRRLQRRYTLIERFDIFLHPGRSVALPGPDPKLVAADAEGLYKILLRVEATQEREGDSDTLAGIVASGGVAGFPMPVLQFTVGSPETIVGAQEVLPQSALGLVSPGEGARVDVGSPVQFSWSALPGAVAYRLELRGPAGAVLNAAVSAGVSSYTSPPWALKEADTELTWRVVAMDAKARPRARSAWRALRTAPGRPSPPG